MTRNEPPGFDPALYEADFFAWTQRQAAALRAMPPDPAVDVEHVAEEIEDLGRRDLRKVTSYLVLVIQHLIKLHAAPTSRDAAHWYLEATNFQGSALDAASPGLRSLIDIEVIWARGRRGVRRFLEDVGAADLAISGCPLGVDELLAEMFDVDAALGKLAAAVANGRPSSHARGDA